MCIDPVAGDHRAGSAGPEVAGAPELRRGLARGARLEGGDAGGWDVEHPARLEADEGTVEAPSA
jgi:hypothetical protein